MPRHFGLGEIMVALGANNKALWLPATLTLTRGSQPVLLEAFGGKTGEENMMLSLCCGAYSAVETCGFVFTTTAIQSSILWDVSLCNLLDVPSLTQ